MRKFLAGMTRRELEEYTGTLEMKVEKLEERIALEQSNGDVLSTLTLDEIFEEVSRRTDCAVMVTAKAKTNKEDHIQYRWTGGSIQITGLVEVAKVEAQKLLRKMVND